MGLGKSLSLISLVATGWSKSTEQASGLRPRRSHDVAALLAYDIVLTSYDIVAQEWRRLDKERQPLYSHSWHRIILDEGK